MTCIAYRDGVLAADSAVWGGGDIVITGHVQKVVRIQDGRLLACTGTMGQFVDFEKWMRSPHGPRPSFTEESGFQAIVVRPDGVVERVDHDCALFRVRAPYYALGRSVVFMLGALAAGASAEQAVRLALQHTDGGAGDVQVERIDISNS